MASNYVLPTSVSATGSTITAKTLSTSLAAQTKTYDGNDTATWASGTIIASGFASGEGASVTKTSGSYNNKNVVGASSVTASLASADFSFTGGGVASNYVLPSSVSATATISKANLTQVTASKTYDGLSTVTFEQMTSIKGVNNESFTARAGTATISDKNVATVGKTLTDLSGLMLTGGNDSTKTSNYNLDSGLPAAGDNNAVTISKAALLYTATPTSSTAGNTPTGLSGAVSGFVNGETQETAASGTLAWTTPATSASSAGSYAINGSGLNANNYSFSQATGNATALTLAPAPAPAPAPAQSTSNVPPPPVVNAPPLPSNTSSASNASLAENTQPFSGSFGINTLFQTVAGTVGNFVSNAAQSTAPSATLVPTAPVVSDLRRNEIFTGSGSAAGGSAGGNASNRSSPSAFTSSGAGTVGNSGSNATQSTAPSATLVPTAPAVSDESLNERLTGSGSATGGSGGGNSTNRFSSSAPGARPGNESREGDSQAQEELIVPALN